MAKYTSSLFFKDCCFKRCGSLDNELPSVWYTMESHLCGVWYTAESHLRSVSNIVKFIIVFPVQLHDVWPQLLKQHSFKKQTRGANYL